MKLPFQMGRYTLVELIGAGAFGRVYRAEVHGDMGFVSEFAVKVLDANIVASNPNVAAQMGDEARILSQLDHPNIVKVIDFKHEEHDVLGDVYYMVLEFVRGIDVGLIVEQLETNCEHVPAAAVLHMGLMVADALEHAHQLNGRDGLPLGIVHRDLKPQNLMVNFRGQVKILDFGIAKARDARLAARTQQGQTKGTVFYMSPEQLTGDELDGRADLFSLSSILFELLLGRRLLDVEVATPADLARAMHTAFEMDIDARLDELRAHLEAGHNGELPDEAVDGWIALLRAGLQKEPQFRPESARVMSEQLEWLRARHPVTDHRNFWARQASFGLERNSGPFQMPLEDVPLVDDEPDSEISPAEDFFGMHSGSVADEAVARTGRPEIPPPEVPVTRAMSVVEGTVRDFGSDSLRSVTSPPNISIMPTLQDGALEAESQSSADETADVAQTLETAAHDPNKAVPLDAESSVDAEPTVAFDGQTELDATVPFARDRKSRLEDTPTDMVPALSKTGSPAGREGGLSSLLLPLVVGLTLIVVGISLFLVLRGGNEASEDRPPLNASAESPASPAQASAGKATAGTVDAPQTPSVEDTEVAPERSSRAASASSTESEAPRETTAADAPKDSAVESKAEREARERAQARREERAQARREERAKKRQAEQAEARRKKREAEQKAANASGTSKDESRDSSKPATADTGMLHISARPRCTVKINGKSYGTTDTTRRGIRLPVGTYKVRFECDDAQECKPFRTKAGIKTLKVQAGKPTRYVADFYALPENKGVR